MAHTVYLFSCWAFFMVISTVIAYDRTTYRDVKNFTYLDCYEVPPFEHQFEVSELTMPYPGYWDGLKGRFHGDQCLRDCNGGKFLYAAITSMVLTNETMQMVCSCGNVRPYVNQRPPYCHWRCGYPDDPMESWCAYPNFHEVSRIYQLPAAEYPEVKFVGCVQDLLDGPDITEKVTYRARIHVFGLWLAKFYAEDCYYDCQWRGFAFAGIHSFWNGKTMVFRCRCGSALPKRQDIVTETFCPWKCTYYNRYPQRWCSYHSDKWWTSVYMIIDKDHPRRMATPYPTPVPIVPEDYMDKTTISVNGLDNRLNGSSHGSATPKPHKPMAPVMTALSQSTDMSLVLIIGGAVACVLSLILLTLTVIMIVTCRRRRPMDKDDPGQTSPSVNIVDIHNDQTHIIAPDNEI